MRPPRCSLLALVLALGACSGLSREGRIEAELEKHGVKPKLAHCMAHKLDKKLSDGDLAALRDAMRQQQGEASSSSARNIAQGLARIDDPHLAETVTRAALGCAIRG